MQPRAFTKEEMREKVLAHARHLAHYWANTDENSVLGKCEGVAFSMLCMIDGVSGLPAMDLSMQPHEDDKQYNIGLGENWVEPGMVINDDCYLHELFHAIPTTTE